ncbi:hypothetical protein B0T20DRAFT_412021 [Sordaria brevicollis]|uniref:Uncharacterized protein n=1 Tax=Sordaria brevicollis TaxID=83679 RepID=A0AAE0PFC1_SORBR|nr:hypothetical protein B0T20DRAFT_412021 [Sordaria brevicollis]
MDWLDSKYAMPNYLPLDAPWSEYSEQALRTQCFLRFRNDVGSADDLRDRLEQYRVGHPIEERLFPWRVRKNKSYTSDLSRARYRRYQVIEVEDNSDKTSVEKRFTLWEPHTNTMFDVIISRIPRCNCRRRVSVLIYPPRLYDA